MKNTPICILCTGFATVTPLLLLKNVDYDIPAGPMFTCVHHLREKKM
jgi:hypothetical protein